MHVNVFSPAWLDWWGRIRIGSLCASARREAAPTDCHIHHFGLFTLSADCRRPRMSPLWEKKRRQGQRKERVLFFCLVYIRACVCDILSARPAVFALPMMIVAPQKTWESSHFLLLLFLPRHSAEEARSPRPSLGAAHMDDFRAFLTATSLLSLTHTHAHLPHGERWDAIRAAATEECLSLTHVALPRLSAAY